MIANPLRVCYCIDNLAPAGTEKQLLRLLETLDREKIQPHLVLLDGYCEKSLALEPKGIPILRLGVKKLASGKAWRAAREFRGFLKSHRIDVLQVYFIDSARLAIPVARTAGVKRIFHVRNNCGYWSTRKLPFLDRFLHRLTDLFLTNSEVAREEWTRLGIPDWKIRILDNFLPTPTATFHPPFQKSVPVVGLVANLRPVKNVDGFLRMAKRIAEKGIRAQYRIAGDGTERAALQRLSEQLGIDPFVRFEGQLSDIKGFLDDLDIAVLCSHSESNSNALLEYLAAGKPVLATDVGRNREWLERTISGAIVDLADEPSWADHLVNMLEDQTETTRRARSGWELYSKLVNESRSIKQWYKLYSIETSDVWPACSVSGYPSRRSA
ncbi:glycosyltransferase [Telmatocola sphagniphila]|uniref:Glycosyltransferase n=1 Tax=Telmatocola sphagniphila TaxID=1123043 RepID=A0A8E6B889_9BACT|nr:glycosyltransferase [Telmatocola sphagniphila]QVL33084.1 glycosyltransferase [Telmatocola sphagniphila]